MRWALVPAGALLATTRVVSLLTSDSSYEGTSVQLGMSSITGTATSSLSTLPTANWGRSYTAVQEAGVQFAVPSTGWLTLLAVASATWWWHGRWSQQVTPADGDLRGVRSLGAPLATVLVVSAGVFAVTGLWGPYLSVPGNTYMGALSAYWVWAVAIAVGLKWAFRRSGRWAAVAGLALVAVVSLQWSINAAVVEVERRSPSPFGVDLIGLVDQGGPADEAQRCALLRGIPQAASLPRWYDHLNTAYAERHGVPFCAVPPTP